MIVEILRSRLFLITFAISISLSLAIAYLVSGDMQYGNFLSISLLGSNMTTTNYYPNNIPEIDINDEMRWYVQVYNRMNAAEYVSIRIKLLNSTHEAPNTNLNTPSPIEHIYEIRKVVPINKTLTIPLKWKVLSTINLGNYTIIREISINDNPINLNIGSLEGKNFRIVIELWRYNIEKRDFEFVWLDDKNKERSAWNQIWFSIK